MQNKSIRESSKVNMRTFWHWMFFSFGNIDMIYNITKMGEKSIYAERKNQLKVIYEIGYGTGKMNLKLQPLFSNLTRKINKMKKFKATEMRCVCLCINLILLLLKFPIYTYPISYNSGNLLSNVCLPAQNDIIHNLWFGICTTCNNFLFLCKQIADLWNCAGMCTKKWRKVVHKNINCKWLKVMMPICSIRIFFLKSLILAFETNSHRAPKNCTFFWFKPLLECIWCLTHTHTHSLSLSLYPITHQKQHFCAW